MILTAEAGACCTPLRGRLALDTYKGRGMRVIRGHRVALMGHHDMLLQFILYGRPSPSLHYMHYMHNICTLCVHTFPSYIKFTCAGFSHATYLIT